MHWYEYDWQKQYKNTIAYLKFKGCKNFNFLNYRHVDYIKLLLKLCPINDREVQTTVSSLKAKFSEWPNDLELSYMNYINAMATTLMFKDNKYIYEFDSKISELLKNSSWRDIPSSYLKLPKSSFAIFIYKNKDNDENKNVILTISITNSLTITIQNEGNLTSVVIPIVYKTIEESIEELCKALNIDIKDNKWKELKPITALVVNSILYLLGDKDVVAEIHPGTNPKKKHIEYKHPLYGKTSTVYQVGSKYRKLIERYELDGLEPHGDGEETGKTVKPHVRSAHFHSYWTGAGRKELKVKFVMSCLVNGHLMNFTDMDDEENITDVK